MMHVSQIIILYHRPGEVQKHRGAATNGCFQSHFACVRCQEIKKNLSVSHLLSDVTKSLLSNNGPKRSLLPSQNTVGKLCWFVFTEHCASS